jgi:hypothetical protein
MQTPIIIDFEASGFGKGSYPIEVGFSGRHGDGWCTLIRPEPEWTHWDQEAENLHNIPYEVLFERGHTVQYVTEQLNARLRGLTVYTDGWAQDYVWMATLFDAASKVPLFTVADLRDITNDAQQAHWHEAKVRVEKELAIARHRASSDARVLQMTWLRTFEAQKHHAY